MQKFFLTFFLIITISNAYGFEYYSGNQELESIWGDKAQEVEERVDEFSEIVRKALINDDFSILEQYVQFPFEFYVEDYRGNDFELRKEVNSYTLMSYSFREFSNTMRMLVKEEPYELEMIMENKDIAKRYSRVATVDLLYGTMWITMKFTCARVLPNLPKERQSCDIRSYKITDVSIKRL